LFQFIAEISATRLFLRKNFQQEKARLVQLNEKQRSLIPIYRRNFSNTAFSAQEFSTRKSAVSPIK
ncbi:hypothetical protein CDE51_12330, partial [Pasteurella multocida]